MPRSLVSALLLTLLTITAAFSETLPARVEQAVTLLSNDKKTEVRVTAGDAVKYSVWYEGREIVRASPISMTVDGNVLGHHATIQKISRDSVRSLITPLYGKFDRITDEYKEMRLDFDP